MKKKLLAMVLTATMAAGLAACGSNNTPAESNEASKGSETVKESEGAATSEVRDVTLTVWGPSEDQAVETGNWLGTMCDAFNAAHPEWNITFTYGVCAEGDAKATVTQDIEAAADVYMFANDNLTDLIAAGAIAELGGSTLEYVTNNMSQALIDSVTVDGGLYGVPFTTNTWFMYYNKSIFTEDDVKTLEGMLEKSKVAFPLNNSWYFASFYAANGCTLFGTSGMDEAAGIDFSGDKAVAVTNYLIDMVKNPNFVHDTDGAGIAGLKDGSIGAFFSGSWDYGNVVAAIGAENVGAAQLPTINVDGKEGSMKAFFGSKAIGVNPHCKDQDVAVALAAFLGGEEAQRAHYELRNTLPTNTTVLADPKIATDPVALASDACIANTSILQPYCAAMGNYWDAATNMANEIINGQVTHDNAAEKTELMNTTMNTSAVQ